jgi:hypothetical protein
MAANDSQSTSDVGYGKPPNGTRFRKGVSGNPKGRPKGTRNLATVLERTLQEKVVINENGIRKTVTKLEAAIKQLVNKAAGGDLLAMRQLTALAGSGEIETVAARNKADLSEGDQKIMNRLLERLQRPEKGKDDDNDD